MRSDKQLQASRTNGAKSRGPATSAGKRNSSQNSLRHGAYSQEVLLRSESRSSFEEFAQAKRDEFQPRTDFESTLVETIIAGLWRAMRFGVMQRALIDHETEKLETKVAEGLMGPDAAFESETIAALAFKDLADNSRALDLLKRYESSFERQALRAHRRLMEVRNHRNSPSPAQTGPNVVPIDSPAKTPERSRQPVENTKIDEDGSVVSAGQSSPLYVDVAIFEKRTIVPKAPADAVLTQSPETIAPTPAIPEPQDPLLTLRNAG